MARWRWPLLIALVAGLSVACSGGRAAPAVRITLDPRPPASPQPARPPRAGSLDPNGPGLISAVTTGAEATPSIVAPTPTAPATVTVAGSVRIATTASLAGDLAPIVQALASEYPKLRLSLFSQPDADAVLKSGADLAIVARTPGAPAVERATTIKRQPIAIALPLTLTPDDLTLAQAVGLITGSVSDWGQVGGTSRPVKLAFSEPAGLAQVGALTGRPDLHPAAVRTDSTATLLGEADAGADEAIVVPWTSLRLKSKAVRIDGHYPSDPDYPIVSDLVLAPLRKEAQATGDQLAAVLSARLAPSRTGTFTLDSMGDLMLARGVATQVQRNGPEWPFAKVVDRLRSSDLRFGNLEFALSDRGVQARKDYTFRAPPSAAQSLGLAGINLVDLANNHVLDYGGQGLLDTLSALARAGVAHTGAGADDQSAHAPAIVEVDGVRTAWLAYVNVPDDSVTGFVARSLDAGPGRPGVAWGTPAVIQRDVTAARQVADVVIVAIHSGFEYTAEPNSIQRDLAHAAIDAGAALVLGAHPHVLQGIEYYRGGVIAYSLGNFIFDLDESDLAHFGLPSVLTVILRLSLDTKGVTGIELYPAIINRNDFRPEPVFGAAAKPVYDRIYQLTDALAKRSQ